MSGTSILEYFDKHPQAKDTAEGIAQWWIHHPVERVEAALRMLVSLGIVSAKETSAGALIYAMAIDSDSDDGI